MDATVGVRKLMMGDTIEVTPKSITIGPVVISYPEGVLEKDVENAMTIYALGLAAKSRFIGQAWEMFQRAIADITIVGFKDPDVLAEEVGSRPEGEPT